MTIENVIEDGAFHSWRGFEPGEIQYAAYIHAKPEVIAAGHKIQDLYWSFCHARYTFLEAYDVASDSKENLFKITNLLSCAILQYGLCYDLLWQIAWAAEMPTSFNLICDLETEKLEKECTRESLEERIGCNISQNSSVASQSWKLNQWLRSVDNDVSIVALREIYNYIKHRGAIYYSELIENQSPIVNVDLGNGISSGIKFPERKEYSIDRIKSLLIDYHFTLEKAINRLIEIVMPQDYKSVSVNGSTFLCTVVDVVNQQQNGGVA